VQSTEYQPLIKGIIIMNTHQTGNTPRKDGEFLTFASRIEQQSRANISPDKWNITPGLIDQLSTDLSKAQTTYNLNVNPNLRNHETAAYKQEAFLTLRRYLSTFINYLEGNTRVPDDALHALGLRPRHPSAHQPIPAPTEAPVLTLLTGQHHDIDIYLYDNQAGHPTEFLTNPNHHAVLLQYRFKGETDWQQKNLTKKSDTLIFNDDAEGKYLQVRAAWLNPRLQQGPWSDTDEKLIN
jgi:hypothetical protein